jgi:hypothetical protein
MKKTIIGSAIMLSGTLITMGAFIAAIILFPTVGQWSGSRLIKVISVNDLGLPFIIGITLSVSGLVILVLEYFNKND